MNIIQRLEGSEGVHMSGKSFSSGTGRVPFSISIMSLLTVGMSEVNITTCWLTDIAGMLTVHLTGDFGWRNVLKS